MEKNNFYESFLSMSRNINTAKATWAKMKDLRWTETNVLG